MKKTFILITLITFLFLSYTACLQFKEKDVSLNKQIIYEVDNLSQNYSTKIITHLELSEFIYLTIELNDTYNSNEFSLLNNDAVSLEDHRIRVNENYCATNNDFLNVYEIMFYDEISISLYAPFIQVKYLDYRNYLKDEKLYHTMLKSTVVKNIYLSDDKTYNYTTRNELHYLNNEITYYPFSNALNDVNVPSSKEYLGDNINIGILELGIPDSYTNFQ